MGTALCRLALAAVAVVVPAPLVNKKAAAPAGLRDRAALAQAGEVAGLLKKVDPTDKTFILELDVLELRGRLRVAATPQHAAVLANQAAHQAVRAGQQEGRLLVQEEKALQTRDPLKRLEKLDKVALEMEKLEEKELLQKERLRLRHEANRLLVALNPGVRLQMQFATFELGCANDLKVRRLEPPPHFTTRGKLKTYTAKELKELKGPDTDLVGYQARFTDLRAGQVIAVTLGVAKAAKDANKNKAHRPVATLIVIVQDVPPPAAPAAKAQK